MKGDYSQPGLMPGRYLEQIDLPSAYLVYAVVSGGSSNFRPAAHRFRILYPIGRSLARFRKIMAIIESRLCFLTDEEDQSEL
jgi:hypothetical protein